MLLERATVPVENAVERLFGMQAQIPRPPYLGLWTRLAGFERDALTTALRERRIVRATAWRGTLHLLTTEDLVAFRGALQPMLSRGMQSILRNRAESFDMEKLVAEARAFFGARPATFDAARAHLAARFPVADERALGYAVRTHLPLVQVPDGSPWGFPAAADFALADEWLGRAIPTGNDGLPELVRRYLAAFGPASISDAQNWSGIGGLRTTFEALRGGAPDLPRRTRARALRSRRLRRARTRRRRRRCASCPSTTISSSGMTIARASSPTPTARG